VQNKGNSALEKYFFGNSEESNTKSGYRVQKSAILFIARFHPADYCSIHTHILETLMIFSASVSCVYISRRVPMLNTWYISRSFAPLAS
jgi:hypothetical protein